MKNYHINSLAATLFTIASLSASNQAAAFCGDSRVIVNHMPHVSLTSIYNAFEEQEFTKAANLIKPMIVHLLGKDFEIPEITIDTRTKTSNPGLYLPQTRQLKIYPQAWVLLAELGLIKRTDLLPTLFIVFTHELVHAWQHQHTNLLKIAAFSDNKALTEGHAVFVQSIIADIYDLTRVTRDGLFLVSSPQFHQILMTTTQAESAAEFVKYTRLDGCRFIASLITKSNGEYCLQQIVNDPPKEPIPRSYVLNLDRNWPNFEKEYCSIGPLKK